MYRRYFGLQEKPFAIAPNPRYLFLGELHREALAHLLYGIGGEGCIILLTGEVGTGKTTVCRSLFAHLPETTDVALVLNPKLSIDDLLKTICEEFDIPVREEAPSIKIYIDRLNAYLLEAHANGHTSVLIIDEAQNLEMEILEQLRLLTNLETDTRKLLQIVLIGQPELQQKLNHPQLRQLSQRITTRYHLGPLKPRDISAYIEHRIAVAGGTGSHRLFTPGAIRHLTRLSNGIPRVINLLCDRALLGAYAENRDHADLKIMRKAGHEVIAEKSGNPLPFKKLALALAFLAVALWLPATLYFVATYGELFPLKRILQPFTVEATLQNPAASLIGNNSLTEKDGGSTGFSAQAPRDKK
jgi:general secretion pathway protein A